jgi:hypothetical protein
MRDDAHDDHMITMIMTMAVMLVMMGDDDDDVDDKDDDDHDNDSDGRAPPLTRVAVLTSSDMAVAVRVVQQKHNTHGRPNPYGSCRSNDRGSGRMRDDPDDGAAVGRERREMMMMLSMMA